MVLNRLALSFIFVLHTTSLMAGNSTGKIIPENNERRKLVPRKKFVRMVSEKEQLRRIKIADSLYDQLKNNGGFNLQ